MLLGAPDCIAQVPLVGSWSRSRLVLVAFQAIALAVSETRSAVALGAADALFDEPLDKGVYHGHVGENEADKGFTNRPVARLGRISVAFLEELSAQATHLKSIGYLQ